MPVERVDERLDAPIGLIPSVGDLERAPSSVRVVSSQTTPDERRYDGLLDGPGTTGRASTSLRASACALASGFSKAVGARPSVRDGWGLHLTADIMTGEQGGTSVPE